MKNVFFSSSKQMIAGTCILYNRILILYRYETVLSKEERQRFRKLVIAMILATDLKASYEVKAICSNF